MTSLSVEPGGFVSLIGHSGCGKSTLLSVMAGLATADAGQALLDGVPISGPGHDRSVVGCRHVALGRCSEIGCGDREAPRAVGRSARPDPGRIERLLRQRDLGGWRRSGVELLAEVELGADLGDCLELSLEPVRVFFLGDKDRGKQLPWSVVPDFDAQGNGSIEPVDCVVLELEVGLELFDDGLTDPQGDNR